MGVGLPLLILTVLSCGVSAVWFFRGAGPHLLRRVVAVVLVLGQFMCWAALLHFGVFASFGTFAMSAGFIVGLAGLVVPLLWQALRRSHNGHIAA
jgi:hypothetical protein